MTSENNDRRDAELTAYTLDELDGAERAAVEARLATDPDARREVEQIRATAMLLCAELASEPTPEPRPATLKLPQSPRRQWRRWAGVAAVVTLASGVSVAIFLPALSSSRRQTHGQALRSVERDRQRSQWQGQVQQPPLKYSNDNSGAYPRQPAAVPPMTAAPADEKKIPYDDILRYPTNWPDVSERRDQTAVTPETPAFSLSTPTPAATAAPAAGAAPAPALVGGLSVDQMPQAAQMPPDAYSRGTLAVRGTRFDSYAYERSKYRSLTPAEVERERHNLPLRPDERDEWSKVLNTEAYDRVVDNRFLEAVQNPLSTFSIDVDTASYSNVRRFLAQGQLPPKDSVRIEELVNYFPYDYAPPKKGAEDPFAAHVEVAGCPWRPEHRLVRVALKGREIAPDKRPASNLVFLLDVSGSMNSANKLPLVKRSMRMLLDQLNGEDRVAIVVYAGNSGLALPSTACTDREKASIENAIESLSAGGSTNGEQGIQLAYSVAQKNFIEGGTNRVILCTDGDFNVGVTNQGDLTRVIEEKAKSGVFLSVLGFGMGNLKDSTMEKLADKGNGNYAYIDTEREGKKVLVEQMSGTLVTIAKDVKIQIEFNPAVVGAYRLIGYENRLLAKEDFNDDKKDAGEIGAGHAVTALYEVVPAGAKVDAPAVDELKYQKPATTQFSPPHAAGDGASNEMLTLKLRYKQPDGATSKLIEVAVKDAEKSFVAASTDFKFASAVAAFGMILRESPHKGSATFDSAVAWAEEGLGEDASGYRREFLELIKQARAATPAPAAAR